jgi:hypothetical protein
MLFYELYIFLLKKQGCCLCNDWSKILSFTVSLKSCVWETIASWKLLLRTQQSYIFTTVFPNLNLALEIVVQGKFNLSDWFRKTPLDVSWMHNLPVIPFLFENLNLFHLLNILWCIATVQFIFWDVSKINKEGATSRYTCT